MSVEMNTNNVLEGFASSTATFAADIDQVLWVNLVLSIILFLSVVVPMLYFAVKYRASNVKDENIENITHHTGLEITWTVVPTLMLAVFFWYGYTSMKTLRTMPDASNAITIKIEGSKWKWRYEYPANANGYVHKLGGAFTKPVQDENGKMIKKGSKKHKDAWRVRDSARCGGTELGQNDAGDFVSESYVGLLMADACDQH